MFLVYLAIILGGIYLMRRIFSSGSSKSEFSGDIKEYSKYESGTIGAMLRKDAKAANRGDMDALIDTIGDRAVARDIIEWFDKKIKTMDYYAIRDTDAEGQEPNYALVMTNDSDYSFKRFSCKAQAGKMGGSLTTVRCNAENWKKGKEAKFKFYCAQPDVSYLSMDVRDISYEIDYAIDDRKYASESLEYLFVIGEDKGTSATRECISMIPDIEVGDRILVRTDTGKEKKTVVKSVCKVKGSDLKRSLQDYDMVLRNLNKKDESLHKIQEVRNALADDKQINDELSKLEEKMSKVLKKADEITYEDPDGKATHLASQIKGSYVPKTIETLKKYGEVLASGIPEESLGNIRADVLKAIDKSNEVYTNILISLYEQDITELSAEIESLQAMFAREGLLNSDFDIKA